MKKLALSLFLLPLVAVAQPAPPRPPQQQAPQQQQSRPDPRERGERRMRLARTLGLAEALDLDAPQALRLGEVLAKFDARRDALATQMKDARDVLQKAARNTNAATAEVDGAMNRLFEARAQLAAIDREMVQTIAKDLPGDKRARAVLFLSRFHDRVSRVRGMHHDEDGRGRGNGEGFGPRRGMRMRGGPPPEVLGFVGPGPMMDFAPPELCPPDEDCLGFDDELELEVE